jgi:hypothetical protein
VSTHSEQQAEAGKPSKQAGASKDADKEAAAADEPKAADAKAGNSSDATEVRLC